MSIYEEYLYIDYENVQDVKGNKLLLKYKINVKQITFNDCFGVRQELLWKVWNWGRATTKL